MSKIRLMSYMILKYQLPLFPKIQMPLQPKSLAGKTIYLAVDLNHEGKEEVLRMWLGKNESSSFWMGVLTDFKVRGVEDILITATDNLNGFTQTLRSIFPESQNQICVVRQIRNIFVLPQRNRLQQLL